MNADNNLSGPQKAEANFAGFVSWVATKTDADFRNIAVRGQLSRQEIAREIGFAKSVLLQNPRVRAALASLEASLRDRGVLPPLAEPNSAPPAVAEMENPRAVADKARLKRLEAENAALRAELVELRSRLKQYRHMEDAFSLTGRLPR
jgi:hypothetical protein